MKILVAGPAKALKNKGGVANHIHGLKPYWSEKFIYCAVGSRDGRTGSGKWWMPLDMLKFFMLLLLRRPDFVWLNPSISANALRRDFMFMRIARALGIKVAFFIHGFDLTTFEKIDKTWVRDNLNRAAFIMVLANDFKQRLEAIGVTSPIKLTSTKVEDSLVEGLDLQSKDYSSRQLLFLARVERAKGIYDTIDAYAILKQKYPDLTLQISGGGRELEAAKAYVASNDIEDINFTGYIAADEIRRSAYNSLMLILITSHGEGMPTNVLEAMAMGLPVITRPVGGLADFFVNGEMGFISDSLDPAVFAAGMEPLIADPALARRVGLANADYASRHFFASQVARQLEAFFLKYNQK